MEIRDLLKIFRSIIGIESDQIIKISESKWEQANFKYVTEKKRKLAHKYIFLYIYIYIYHEVY